MKNTILLLIAGVLLVLTPTSSQAQTSWTAELNTTFVPKAKANVQANIFASIKDDRTGGYYWGLFQKGYGEVIVGGSFYPLPWISLNAGVGGEFPGKDSSVIRAMVHTFAAKNGYSLLAIREISAEEFGSAHGTGPWHKVVAMKSLNKNVAIGVIDQSFRGHGPKLDLSSGHYTVWMAPTWKKYADIGKNGYKFILAFDASF